MAGAAPFVFLLDARQGKTAKLSQPTLIE